MASGLSVRPRLFKRRIALSIGKITIQRISIRKTDCTIHWIEIYPLDSVIHLLNNWAKMMTSLLLKKFIRLEISNIYSNVLKAKPKKVEQESETFKTTLLKKIREIKYCFS